MTKLMRSDTKKMNANKPQQIDPFAKLLHDTALHDSTLERIKLQKLKEDSLHRKFLMLLRNKKLAKFKYFKEITD